MMKHHDTQKTESVRCRMTSGTNRRDFLKTATLTGAGFWVGGSAPSVLGKSKNEKLNLAFIGCGGKGEFNLMMIRGLGQNIVALCDVDEKRAAKAFKSSSKTPKYHDYRKMLEERKDIDAVIVSTPDHHHAPAAVMAMKLGKHVYCEKPMAHSIYEARQMMRVAAEMKVATQMGNQGHAGNNLRRAVEIVHSGAIGNVREFHAWTNRPHWPQGLDRPTEVMPVPDHLKWNLWLGPAPKRPYHEAYVPFRWRGWWDFGTGALGDMACHIVDLGFWALKLAYPIRVEAEVSAMHAETAPAWSVIRYDFPQRGDLPPVRLTWYDGGKKPDPALVGRDKLPENGSILVGDQGTMYIPDTYGRKYRLLPKEKFADYKGPPETIGRAINQNPYLEWMLACKGEAPSLSNFVDYAGPLTEVVLLGNVAIRLGKKIDWDGENMKAKNCPEAEPLLRPSFREGWTV